MPGISVQSQNNKDKKEILKEARDKKHFMYRGTRIRITLDFSLETTQTGREWSEISEVLKEKSHQT